MRFRIHDKEKKSKNLYLTPFISPNSKVLKKLEKEENKNQKVFSTFEHFISPDQNFPLKSEKEMKKVFIKNKTCTMKEIQRCVDKILLTFSYIHCYCDKDKDEDKIEIETQTLHITIQFFLRVISSKRFEFKLKDNEERSRKFYVIIICCHFISMKFSETYLRISLEDLITCYKLKSNNKLKKDIKSMEITILFDFGISIKQTNFYTLLRKKILKENTNLIDNFERETIITNEVNQKIIDNIYKRCVLFFTKNLDSIVNWFLKHFFFLFVNIQKEIIL